MYILLCTLGPIKLPDSRGKVCYIHFADDGQQARNSCTGLPFFSLGSHTLFDHVYTCILVLKMAIQNKNVQCMPLVLKQTP